MPKILVVDDVPDNVALLTGWLEPRGYELICANSGIEALQRANQTTPDLALLDLAMPGLDGIELARLLHRRPATKSLPIIIVTAHGAANERLRALEGGVLEVLTKPIEPAELLARVASVLRMKALNDELLRTREELIRTESLATIGLLVAGAAHEINNPLASALSFIEMIRDGLDEGTAKHDLDFAIEQLGRVKRLVAALLGLSRQTNDYSETLTLERVARDTLRLAAAQPEAEQVKMEIAPGAPETQLKGNFAQLAQVALNFVTNALQAVPKTGGKVSVAVGDADDKLLGKVTFLRVGDNGPGVPESIREKLFKPFFTTKPAGSGVGLGLYTCQIIADRHRGRIDIATSPLGGAEFTLWIPLGH